MTEQALVVKENGRTKLAPYGSSAELKQYAQRVMAGGVIKLTGGNSRKLSPIEAGVISQICIAHGLDYFAGDVFATVDRDGNFVPVLGRNAWVKAANNAIAKSGGGNFWYDKREIVDDAERINKRIPAGAIAYEVTLYDTPSIRAYSEAAERLAKAGASWTEIKESIGGRPCTFGIGFYQPGDKTKYQDAQWSPAERAEKRALTAALKKRYNLPFDEFGEGADELPADYLVTVKNASASEATVTQTDNASDDYVPTDAQMEAVRQAREAQRKKDNEALYGDE